MVGKKISFLVFFLLALTACKKNEKKDFKPKFLSGAAYILQINEDDFFVRHPDYLSRQLFHKTDWSFFRKIKPEKKSVFHFFAEKNGNKWVALLPPEDSVKLNKNEVLRYNGAVYYKLNGENKNYYFFCNQKFCLVSDNKILAEKLLRTTESEFLSDTLASEMQNYVNTEASGYWFVFPGNIRNNRPDLFGHKFILKHLGEVLVWDLENTGDLSYGGVTLTNDEVRTISEIFDRVSPYETAPETYLPGQTESYLTLTFDAFELFYKSWTDFKTYAGYKNDETDITPFKSLKSITYARSGRYKYLVGLFGKSPELLLESFSHVSSHNDVEIYRTGKDSLVARQIFYPLFDKTAFPYAVTYDNYVIWTHSIPSAEKLIRSIEQNDVLSETETHTGLMAHAPRQYNLASYRNGKYYTFKQIDGLLFVNFKALENLTPDAKEKSPRKASWQKISSIKASNFHIPPRWIYNHRTKKFEIVYQDIHNRLVLTDAKGKIRWKKNINAPVTSEIYQVDMFRNGKRQFVFSTPSGIYSVDILGQYISPFPLKKNITSPVSVFDYDNNKNYRLCFAEGNYVKIYNLQAKEVKGFAPVKLTDTLQFAPQHIRIQGKDYILLQQKDGTLRIVNRRGKDRIKIKEKIRVKTPWFKHKNRFVAINSQGRLVRVDTKGKIEIDTAFSGLKNACFHNNRSILIDEKHVWINGKKLDIPASDYDSPGIFFIARKPVYVFIDQSAKEVILYDGKTLTRLPGDYQADLLIKPQAQYLLTRYLPDEIIIYYKK